MTDKDKELLIKDLCSRLPYGVILKCADLVGEELRSITKEGLINNDYDIDEVKPMLFPLSNMTEKQKDEFYSLITEPAWKIIDFCNKHHLDCRGLISIGLAIDATNLNIY